MDLGIGLFQQSFWSGITIGSVYALIAIGVTLMYKVSKILNLAQGEFYMLGALSLYSFITYMQMPSLISILIALLVSAAFGYLLFFMAIRPLKNPTILALIIATVAFGKIMQGAAFLVWGNESYSVPALLSGDSVRVGAASVQPQVFLILIVLIVVTGGLYYLNQYTYFGKTLRAVANNPYAAGLVGINVRKITLIVFMIGAALGGLAGILAGPISAVTYFAGSTLGLKALIAVLLGGLGSYGGAIIGSLVLGLLESFGAGYISSLLKEVFSFTVLLVLLILSPNGLAGLKFFKKK